MGDLIITSVKQRSGIKREQAKTPDPSSSTPNEEEDEWDEEEQGLVTSRRAFLQNPIYHGNAFASATPQPASAQSPALGPESSAKLKPYFRSNRVTLIQKRQHAAASANQEAKETI